MTSGLHAAHNPHRNLLDPIEKTGFFSLKARDMRSAQHFQVTENARRGTTTAFEYYCLKKGFPPLLNVDPLTDLELPLVCDQVQ